MVKAVGLIYYGGKGTGGRGARLTKPITPTAETTTADRFADRHGTLYARINTDKVAGGLKNPETGVALYRNLAEILAEKLAKAMVDALRMTIVRPAVSTKRLEEALLAPENRYARAAAFGVGVPAFLNKKVPYWRAIEQGTSYFVGRTLYGIWGGSIENLTGGGTGRYGPYPAAGSPYSPVTPGATGGRFRPLTTEFDLEWARKVTKTKAGETLAHRMEIKRPIRAHHYMQEGWVNFDARGEGRKWAARLVQAYTRSL